MDVKYSLGRLSEDEVVRLILHSPITEEIEKKLGVNWINDHLSQALNMFKAWLKD